jgi:hypothetical protein
MRTFGSNSSWNGGEAIKGNGPPPNIRQLMVSTILAFWYFYHLLFKDTADEGYTKKIDKYVQQRIKKN